MDRPKASIIIPTYNQDKYIVRAIQSALSQDYPNLEVIISDDNSGDGTKEVVEEYLLHRKDSRIRYFRNTENLGTLKNYKKSLYELASGDWVINLDGDDFFIDPNFISKAVELSSNNEAVVLVFGNYCEYYQDTSKMINILNNSNLPMVMDGEEFLMRYSNGEISWNHNSIFYKRSNAIGLGFYWHESIPRNDWESFLRLVVNNRVGHIKSISAAWTQHELNETKRTDVKKYLNNYSLIEGIATYAANSGMNEAKVAQWKKNMFYRSTRGSCIGYIKNRDLYGAMLFLSYAGKEDWSLPLKVIFSPGIIIRTVLSMQPSFYTKAKAIARKISLR